MASGRRLGVQAPRAVACVRDGSLWLAFTDGGLGASAPGLARWADSLFHASYMGYFAADDMTVVVLTNAALSPRPLAAELVRAVRMASASS